MEDMAAWKSYRQQLPQQGDYSGHTEGHPMAAFRSYAPQLTTCRMLNCHIIWILRGSELGTKLNKHAVNTANSDPS